MNEYWAQMVKMWQAQQAWDAMVWQNMQSVPVVILASSERGNEWATELLS